MEPAKAVSSVLPFLLFKLLKDNEIQFLNDKFDDETFEFCLKHNLGLDVHYKAITKEVIKKYHKAGLKVNAWTVNDPTIATKFAKMGIDYITSDIIE